MPIFVERLTDTQKRLQKLARKKLFEPRFPTEPLPPTPTEPSAAAVVNRFGATPPSLNELPPLQFPTAQPEPIPPRIRRGLEVAEPEMQREQALVQFWEPEARRGMRFEQPVAPVESALEAYWRNVLEPAAATQTVGFQKMWLPGAQEIERRAQQFKREGLSPIEAATRAYRESDLPPGVKGAIELGADPLNLVPGLGVVPAKVLPQVGKTAFRAGRVAAQEAGREAGRAVAKPLLRVPVPAVQEAGLRLVGLRGVAGASEKTATDALRVRIQALEKQAYARGASAEARASVREELAATREKLASLEGKLPARAPTVEEGEAILAKAQGQLEGKPPGAVTPGAAEVAPSIARNDAQVIQSVDDIGRVKDALFEFDMETTGRITGFTERQERWLTQQSDLEYTALSKLGNRLRTLLNESPPASRIMSKDEARRLIAGGMDVNDFNFIDMTLKPGTARYTPRDTIDNLIRKIRASRGSKNQIMQMIDETVAKGPSPKVAEAVPPGEVPPVAKAVTPEVAGPVVPPLAKPPVTAAGAGAVPPKPGTFAANIRLSKYPEDIRATIKEWADANPEAVQEARRGVRSDAQVLADAKTLVEDMGGNFQRLQRRWKPGEAWNAEELVAIRGTLRAKAGRVVDAGKAARAVDSTANQAEFVLALEDAARTQEIVHGVTAEAGRGLRSFRQQAFDAVRSGDAEKMEEIIRRLGGRAKVSEIADALSRLDVNDPIAVNNFIQKATKPKLWDYIIELFYNSILSGPKTHIINATTNTGTTLLSPSERLLGATIEQGLARLQGRPVERFFSEIPADVVGAVSGLKEGVQAGLQTLKTGIRPSQATKWEFTPKAFKGPLGRVINAPSTTLEAADALGFAVNYRQALGGIAVRKAKNEGLRGQAYIERLAELKLNPSPEMIKEASKIAEYRLFRQPLGTVSARLMTFRDSFPALRFVIPFLRTPINLVKFGLERSPVGIVNPELWRNLAAKNPAASDQIARVFLGSTIAAATGWLFAEGKITGRAPSNAAERDRFYREGKQAFSVRIGDKWVQYQRLEPYNQTFGMVAAAVEAIQNGDKNATQKVADAVFTYSENLMSQTYLSGLSDLLSAMEQPERYGTQYLGRLASGAIPASALLRTTAQMVDPTIRRPQNVAESMQMTIPGLSGNVPPSLTAFGEPARRQSPPWSPIQVSPAQQTAIDAELARLGIEVGFVGNTIGGISLSREEKAQYQVIAGREAAQALARLIPLAEYKRLNDEGKERSIQGAIDSARERARNIIVKQRQQARPSASVSPPTPSFPEAVAPPSAPSQGPGMAPDWLLEKYGKKQPAGVR